MAACVRVLCVGAPPFAVFEGWVRACIRTALTLSVLFSFLPLLSCSGKPDPNALVMIIESSPTNLDPRVGLDAYSERIDNLLFDDLLTRDEQWNLSDGAIGIVPFSSGAEITDHPMGSGPFRFVSAQQDKEVTIERNADYWGQKSKVKTVRFMVVPDTTTRALELRKGSADIAINALTPDMVLTLQRESNLQTLRAAGTVLGYLAFNIRDPILKDARVRQALAYAIDRRPILEYLWRDFARPANSILPPESWAYNGDVPHYEHNPERARQLLQQAGYPEVNGVRFHLTMKTSTEESTRLMAAVFQQQLRDVGIALDIRTYEFATFFSDVTHGEFQLYSLRWIGGNEDPDIFEYVFHSEKFAPHGANRSYYSNPRVDALIDEARSELDQNTRKQLYAEIQRILADELPYINLWYQDNVLVHSTRVQGLTLNPSGNYDFLKTAELVANR